jgi:Flp pilus assembly protein TadG
MTGPAARTHLHFPRVLAAGERERGTAVVIELIILAPLFMALVCLVLLFGRMLNAKSAVDGAARDGVRAASLARSPRAAAEAASSAVAADLAGPQRTRCAAWDVETDTARFTPGGQVVVTVTCQVRLADLALLHVPGTKTIRASYPAPIDRFRGVQ